MSQRSVMALNLVNFFIAQIAAVVIPFLNVYLREHGWRYDHIGIAMACGSLGSLIFQIPAGMTCDRFPWHREALAWSALVLGLCYFGIPRFVDDVTLVVLVLFVSGIPGTFFAPLLGSLALALGGQSRLNVVLGQNQSWNHAGSVMAAFMALVVVKIGGIEPLFYIASGMAILAAASCYVIQASDLKLNISQEPISFSITPFLHKARDLLRRRDVFTLLMAISLFHMANGPLGTMVPLYMKKLGADDATIAWVVLIAQPIMIPVAWWMGKFGSIWSHKNFLALAFFLLPIRLLLYTFVSSPKTVLLVTAIDGIISGIYGVVVVLICSDLTFGKNNFNSLMGLVYTAPALGAVLGVALQGYLVQRFDFHTSFTIFACLTVLAAIYFVWRMPETELHGT